MFSLSQFAFTYPSQLLKIRESNSSELELWVSLKAIGVFRAIVLASFIHFAVFGLGVICFTYISITFNQPHYVQPGFLLHLLSICIIFDLVCNSLVLVWDVLAFWRRWGPICVPAIVFYAGFGSHLIFYGKRPADFWVRKIGFGWKTLITNNLNRLKRKKPARGPSSYSYLDF